MNELLMRITAAMPMKQIDIDVMGAWIYVPLATGKEELHEGTIGSKPYLQRYYAGTFRDGSDLWLHRFLSADGDRHLHSHPFEFDSIILHGGYTEEFIDSEGVKKTRNSVPSKMSQLPFLLEETIEQISTINSRALFHMAYGYQNSLDVYDWHRIASVLPETWTAVIVKPKRLPKWFFKDDNGKLSDMTSSHRGWWKDYKVRPESGIAGDDNRK